MHLGKIVAVVLSLVLAAGAGVARAETYPARPITLIVPYSAGGGTDIMARLVANELSKMWGQPVIVDNRPGASGNIGAERVAHADPDGYTLLVTAGALAIAPSLYVHLTYDPRLRADYQAGGCAVTCRYRFQVVAQNDGRSDR